MGVGCLKISEGLFSHGVIQRNLRNVSNASFSGECENTGVLKAYITCEDKIVEGFYPAIVGSSENGSIKGQLDGLPSGGPYNIRLVIEEQPGEAAESLDLEDVLVGDVWILAGQSNMEGNGYIKDALEPADAVHACYLDDNWDIAKDPIHFMGVAADEIHIELCGGIRPEKGSHVGTGPGIAFAQEMHRMTGVPQGLIACAHGGTSMSQWNPSLKYLEGKSLYGSMVRRFIKNGGKIAGVLWYQGCNDANPDDVQFYTSRMKELVQSMRKDFGNNNLPIVAVQLSRVAYPLSMGAVWNSIQEQQRLLPKSIENLYVVPSIDLTLDDWIHISGVDHKRLGIRCTQAMAVMKDFSKSYKPPIELRDIIADKDPISGSINIIVSYDNVIGKLEATGRPSGFELSEKPNELNCYGIYRIDLNGSSVILKTTINYIDDVNNRFLHYGFGVQPYCNITDSAGRSLPVMGPVRVGPDYYEMPKLL